MPTAAHKEAAGERTENAPETSEAMSHTDSARAQPERQEPEETGAGGAYYRIEVRDKNDFETFRTHDVGDPGQVQRLAGQRESGSWDTVAWLIAKDAAHVEHAQLVADTNDVREVLAELGSPPAHTSGDRFKADPTPDVPKKQRPTQAQRKARHRKIRRAQQASPKNRDQ